MIHDLIINGMAYFAFLLKRKVMRNKQWNSICSMNGFFECVMRKVIRDAGEFREVQWYDSANDNEMNYEMNFFKDYLRSYFFMKNGLLILLVMALNVIRNIFHGNLGTRILFGFCILEDLGHNFMVDAKFWI